MASSVQSMLQYLPYTGAVARRGAAYGEGSGTIFMDNVMCTGSEITLLQCPHTSDHNCVHSDDASVVCQPCKFV